jgi:cysteine desulfurase/selenocysteine lyase
MDIETTIDDRINSLSKESLHEKIKHDFIGLDTKYQVFSGKFIKRTYLDSTASSLMMGAAYRAGTEFLKHYSNTHSLMHFSAKIATKTYAWIHQRMLDFVKADPEEYTCFFTGSGTTSGMNRIARTLNQYRPDRDIVLVSIMEHHSNDLPHRKHGGKVMHIPVDTHESKMGSIDMNLLEKYLKEFSDRVNYVSVTGISNVTGIINPINEVAELAHKYGAYIIVDAAQLAAHVPIQMSGFSNKLKNIDALIFSGHKTYAPGSPGVVIARKSFLSAVEPDEVGGGMVDRVFPDNYYTTKKFPDREEAGTPNILGAITLGAAIHVLDSIGMDTVLHEDMELTNYAINKMLNMEDVIIYGETSTEKCPRAGTISFNIKSMDHGLVAAILNDYFNIAVRNECFCAHPYVEKMLEMTHGEEIKEAKDRLNESPWHIEPWMGMVRASFGIYNNKEEIDYFIKSLKDILDNKAYYKTQYSAIKNGDYSHKSFHFSSTQYFTLSDFINKDLSNV